MLLLVCVYFSFLYKTFGWKSNSSAILDCCLPVFCVYLSAFFFVSFFFFQYFFCFFSFFVFLNLNKAEENAETLYMSCLYLVLKDLMLEFSTWTSLRKSLTHNTTLPPRLQTAPSIFFQIQFDPSACGGVRIYPHHVKDEEQCVSSTRIFFSFTLLNWLLLRNIVRTSSSLWF